MTRQRRRPVVRRVPTFLVGPTFLALAVVFGGPLGGGPWGGGPLGGGPLSVQAASGPSSGKNSPPTAVLDAYTGSIGSTLVVPAPGVLANDTDPDGDMLFVDNVNEPNIGTLSISANGSFKYTPPLLFLGQVTFTYRAEDGDDHSQDVLVRITITLLPGPTAAPTATPKASPTPAPTATSPPIGTATFAPGTTAKPSPTPPDATGRPSPTLSGPSSNRPGDPAGSLPTDPFNGPDSLGPTTSETPGVGPPGAEGRADQTRSPDAFVGTLPRERGDGAFRVAGSDADGLAAVIDMELAGFEGMSELFVPALVLSIPGSIIILIVLVQLTAGLAWMPVVGRWISARGQPPGRRLMRSRRA